MKKHLRKSMTFKDGNYLLTYNDKTSKKIFDLKMEITY